jgi:hypothetical protein
MIVTAYRCGYKKDECENPEKGSYGFKISISDRDRNFQREWGYILLKLSGENNAFKVNINKNSFWSVSCRELVHKNIKELFLKNKIIPWEKGKPPKIQLKGIENNSFKASII